MKCPMDSGINFLENKTRAPRLVGGGGQSVGKQSRCGSGSGEKQGRRKRRRRRRRRRKRGNERMKKRKKHEMRSLKQEMPGWKEKRQISAAQVLRCQQTSLSASLRAL